MVSEWEIPTDNRLPTIRHNGPWMRKYLQMMIFQQSDIMVHGYRRCSPNNQPQWSLNEKIPRWCSSIRHNGPWMRKYLQTMFFQQSDTLVHGYRWCSPNNASTTMVPEEGNNIAGGTCPPDVVVRMVPEWGTWHRRQHSAPAGFPQNYRPSILSVGILTPGLPIMGLPIP